MAAYGIFTCYCEQCGATLDAPMVQDARVTCRWCGQLYIVTWASPVLADGAIGPADWCLWRISKSADDTLRAMGI